MKNFDSVLEFLLMIVIYESRIHYVSCLVMIASFGQTRHNGPVWNSFQMLLTPLNLRVCALYGNLLGRLELSHSVE